MLNLAAARIAIPIHNAKGEVVAYAGRWPGNPPDGTPKYRLPTGFRKGLELFNLDRAIQEPADKPLVIVEGFFDAVKLHQHGCRKVVALMGSSLSRPHHRRTSGLGMTTVGMRIKRPCSYQKPEHP
jgi:DNA primase